MAALGRRGAFVAVVAVGALLKLKGHAILSSFVSSRLVTCTTPLVFHLGECRIAAFAFSSFFVLLLLFLFRLCYFTNANEENCVGPIRSLVCSFVCVL